VSRERIGSLRQSVGQRIPDTRPRDWKGVSSSIGWTFHRQNSQLDAAIITAPFFHNIYVLAYISRAALTFQLHVYRVWFCFSCVLLLSHIVLPRQAWRLSTFLRMRFLHEYDGRQYRPISVSLVPNWRQFLALAAPIIGLVIDVQAACNYVVIDSRRMTPFEAMSHTARAAVVRGRYCSIATVTSQ